MPSIFVPTTPEGQARPRLLKSGAVHSPISAFRQAGFVEAFDKRPAAPLDGPLRLEVDFICPRPASTPARQVLKWTKPDVDNLLKGAMDALKDARWCVDDGRFCEVQSRKRYPLSGEFVGAAITVVPLRDPAWKTSKGAITP